MQLQWGNICALTTFSTLCLGNDEELKIKYAPTSAYHWARAESPTKQLALTYRSNVADTQRD